MRLVKRVTVGVLAAAMALSMLTACTVNDVPSSSGSTEQPGTSQGEDKKDDNNKKDDDKKDDNKKDDDKKDDDKKDDTTVAFAKSQTYNWLMNYEYSTQTYIKKTSVQDGTVEEWARSGDKIYKSKQTSKKTEVFKEKNGDSVENYDLYVNRSIALKRTNAADQDTDFSKSISEYKYGETVEKATQSIGGVMYNAEVVSMEDPQTGDKSKAVYCFNEKGTLVYIIPDYVHEKDEVVKVEYDKKIPSTVPMQAAETWEVYTRTKDAKWIAPDGHELTKEERTALAKKIGVPVM